MNDAEFLSRAESIVKKYALDHLDKSDPDVNFAVYIVWHCFILGNMKALLSTTLPDGMYYECTYDKDQNKIYFDAYKKFENRAISVNNET